MTREEQLKSCRICKNQKFSMNRGIICRLTDEPADFEDYCRSFTEDAERRVQNAAVEIRNELNRKTASQNKRFANYLIDLVFLLIFTVIFSAGLGMVLALLSPSTLAVFTGDNKLAGYLVGFMAGMIYYSFMEVTTGRTIAKFITKTKVVNEKGEQPEIGSILLRSLCRFIPFEQFSFLGSGESGWHDTLSKTRVIEI